MYMFCFLNDDNSKWLTIIHVHVYYLFTNQADVHHANILANLL